MSRYLITSALPYINGIKHLGNLVGSMLPADVYARFLRACGHEVLFICATDEHGTPAEIAAMEAGLDVADYCAKMHDAQAETYRRFNLSFDHFGRSSSLQNAELTRYFCERLDCNGYIYERVIAQVYSVDDNRFLPDRYILGTCPHCGSAAARGDQCDECTRVLDPTDLIAPRSALSGSTNLKVVDTRHLFLKQSGFVGRLRNWLEAKENWPLLVTSIANKWLNEGLKDRCITRDLSWGVSVDRLGFEDKVFYVWFDAPIEYIGATKEWSDQAPNSRDWKSWWTDAPDLQYVQFMAKDNIPFHTISFPCTIMGANEGQNGSRWMLPTFIKGMSWLNYYGSKFSTRERHGIFLDSAVAEFPADYFRYWLMSNIPESNDSIFTWSAFAAGVNKDLADVLGNFVNRCLKFTIDRFGHRVPEFVEFGAAENRLITELESRRDAYTNCMNKMEYRRGMAELRAIWVEGNNYLHGKAPWKMIKSDVKSDREDAAATMAVGINLIRLFALLAWPVIPDSADRMLDCLGLGGKPKRWPDAPMADELQVLPSGHAFGSLDVLFKKIRREDVLHLASKYGGDESEAASG